MRCSLSGELSVTLPVAVCSSSHEFWIDTLSAFFIRLLSLFAAAACAGSTDWKNDRRANSDDERDCRRDISDSSDDEGGYNSRHNRGNLRKVWTYMALC